MKKYFILIISLFFLNSCSFNKDVIEYYACPDVFFSKNHRLYIASQDDNVSLDNISFKAKIDNYSFVKGCKIIEDDILATLSLLFIIYPDKIKKSEIIIPYYIAFLDDQKNIIDIQYYKAIANLNKNSEDSVFIETEANIIIDIKFSLNNINDEFSNDILVGFMLDEKKVNIIN